MTQEDFINPSPPLRPERAIKGPGDLWNLLAKTRGVPDGWKWFRLEVADVKAPRHQSASLVTGAVATERFKSGPRKGEINWAKRDKSTERTLCIPFAEFDAFEAKWEADNNACSSCGGAGKWESGRECHSCKGTGKPRR